jgi:hypothetical protein
MEILACLSKKPFGNEEVYYLYMEPCDESLDVKRSVTIVNLRKRMIRQDAAAKIMIRRQLKQPDSLGTMSACWSWIHPWL